MSRRILLLACMSSVLSCTIIDEYCLIDSDCPNDLICADDLCLEPCETDDDCPEDRQCRSSLYAEDENRRFCGWRDPDPDPDPIQFPVPEPKNIYQFLKVVDVSTEDCDSQQPGSELTSIALFEGSGEFVGFARIFRNESTGSNNLFTRDALNGRAPEADGEDVCVTPHQWNTMSLGCGGFAVFQIVDDAGDALEIVAGQSIVVNERPVCDESPPSTFEVLVCGANWRDDCQPKIGAGSGRITSVVPEER